ncbi:hydroxyethylthiazole kinase [Neorhizobium sp. 2083]|uniref:hydroxyethylthiazole kinase n=1 Tax=Neorhizobium sp. 2083 TaxID=2817762 RepID=UPI002859CF2C|nr:hydroxyethylthiazole kinase [Neorhizobium sp. 2083]MDR6817980.1 hydroxyethylthiazole kinase [Neorhizobium sp. 2083]
MQTTTPLGTPLEETPGQLLAAMRTKNPLVQNITNFVAMNIAANVMLAAGASPAMVHTKEEAGEFARIAAALTVNIGTLSPDFLAGMKAAAGAASEAGKPWVLDPVAHYATAYRRAAVGELMELRPTVIRGNASEIIALAGSRSSGHGVDSGDSVMAAEGSAIALARQNACVIAVTGEVDFVTDGRRSVRVLGGSALMPRVTALGCSLTCLTGAFAATVPDKPFEATVAALAMFAVAGEEAALTASGPGFFSPIFLDRLAALTGESLDAQARIVAA